MFTKIILLCLMVSLANSISPHQILIVVSYDAFRYNYFETKHVPNMKQLRKLGTYADYLVNVFPTKTFPNHQSIATGLYPETHGVIGNSYYDPVSKTVITPNYELFHYNDDIIPIWRYNEDLGSGRYSGSMMWPGAIYPYQNKNITYAQAFQHDFDWHKRIDTAMSWIEDPEKPANLVMVYFEEPDTHGHVFGPNSQMSYNLLEQLDNITQYLAGQLRIRGLGDKVNVVHLSDHGLSAVTPSRFINITQYLKLGTYNTADTSPLMSITPEEGFEDEIYQNLKTASKYQHFNVFKKDEFLSRWHYKNNPRSPPILVMAEKGYALDDLIEKSVEYAALYNFTVTPDWEFGVHGYDYDVPEMHPFFMVRGPRIKPNYKVSPFNTVDLFNLFCELLEIEHVTNNGSFQNVQDIFLDKEYNGYTLSSIITITVGGVLLALTLISCAAFITLMMIKRQQYITTTAALNKRFPQTFTSSIEAQHLLDPEEA